MLDFFIIGTQKSGTSSLNFYLSQHPEIISHNQLECSFFFSPEEYERGEDYFFKNYFFHCNQSEIDKKKLLIKHSTAHNSHYELKNAVSNNPDTQFLIIFRNPVDRFLSSYLMEVERGNYKKSIEEAFDISIKDKNSFEHRAFNYYGQYDLHIIELQKIIRKENIHLILFEDFKQNQKEVLANLTHKLGLNQFDYNELKSQNSYSQIRYKGLLNLINKIKKSAFFKKAKLIFSPKFKYQVNALLTKITFTKKGDKPLFSNEIKNQIYLHYENHIKNFENITGLSTKWTKPK